LFEFVGTIVLLATLFSSVGFSGWTYGENLIQNGNFSEVRGDNASLPAYWHTQDWSDCSLTTDTNDWSMNRIGYIVGEYANVSYDGMLDIELQSASFRLDEGKYYYISFDYYPFNAEDYIGSMYFIRNTSGCNAPLVDIGRTPQLWWNGTSLVQNLDMISSFSILPIDDGWYRVSGYTNSSFTGGANATLVFLSGAELMLNYSLDNVVLEEATCDGENCGALNLSIGLSEPADGIRSMSSPIEFSYAVLSNYDVLNCSLLVDSMSETGGFVAKQYNSTPVIEGGARNYFELSGLDTKDTFVWTVGCITLYDPQTVYLGGNRTYIYDPMYAGAVATNILRLAPILLGLFCVFMTFVWVMNRESEEFLSVLMHMFVLYMILAVMLIILFGIL
jgi:hypothetical protein